MRGFFGIGIYEHKFTENIGTLWRHAYIYNASFIFTVGKKYKNSNTDTLKAPRHIPLYQYEDFNHFKLSLPVGTKLIGIELVENSQNMKDFNHPKSAIYLLGSEYDGIPLIILNQCDSVIKIESPKNYSLNVSTTGTLVMYDRFIKEQKDMELRKYIESTLTDIINR